ncbi:MAG: amphi-Trp domain-containing protein [Candidatus Nanohaloarchaea archaeon]
MGRKLLESTTRMSREEAGEKLEEIAGKLGEGRLELSSGDNAVELQPGRRVEFEIEVEEEADGDTSLEIDIEWIRDEEGSDIEIR